ncbi:hypothetical protein [Rhizobium chutanense]|uniref:hypothetical protein n=1 Tax=Rhizobium chutanense TaxID=2035448 RepID=UPI001FE1EEF4|nr:hypothetical protein [Rhizobium chutanense]
MTDWIGAVGLESPFDVAASETNFGLVVCADVDEKIVRPAVVVPSEAKGDVFLTAMLVVLPWLAELSDFELESAFSRRKETVSVSEDVGAIDDMRSLCFLFRFFTDDVIYLTLGIKTIFEK